MKRKMNKGITLIALIVTIVILIILATISFNFIFGERRNYKNDKSGKRISRKSRDRRELKTCCK